MIWLLLYGLLLTTEKYTLFLKILVNYNFLDRLLEVSCSGANLSVLISLLIIFLINHIAIKVQKKQVKQ